MFTYRHMLQKHDNTVYMRPKKVNLCAKIRNITVCKYELKFILLEDEKTKGRKKCILFTCKYWVVPFIVFTM